jgi:hypothetical protein
MLQPLPSLSGPPRAFGPMLCFILATSFLQADAAHSISLRRKIEILAGIGMPLGAMGQGSVVLTQEIGMIKKRVLHDITHFKMVRVRADPISTGMVQDLTGRHLTAKVLIDNPVNQLLLAILADSIPL